MKNYDDISTSYNATDTSYDGSGLLSYVFSEITTRSETIGRSISRFVYETITKTENVVKMYAIIRKFTEISSKVEILVKQASFSRLFTESLSKIESLLKTFTFTIIAF